MELWMMGWVLSIARVLVVPMIVHKSAPLAFHICVLVT